MDEYRSSRTEYRSASPTCGSERYSSGAELCSRTEPVPHAERRSTHTGAATRYRRSSSGNGYSGTCISAESGPRTECRGTGTQFGASAERGSRTEWCGTGTQFGASAERGSRTEWCGASAQFSAGAQLGSGGGDVDDYSGGVGGAE
ncbi:hypothetical protein [Nocardia terpenica]|uniref:Uncharacterized protein n=1 Tax=Nocardia terpenica TaxID=455432 RepID=A0A164NBW9_9NOCA|nr:hypothetical protein [Nocardia terpenica]KZM74196.1 hypothetical protein AWN90_26175 [Nocardia terpenica]NQE92831.1 hypothetical protein [Nocardia terpenica]